MNFTSKPGFFKRLWVTVKPHLRDTPSRVKLSAICRDKSGLAWVLADRARLRAEVFVEFRAGGSALLSCWR